MTSFHLWLSLAIHLVRIQQRSPRSSSCANVIAKLPSKVCARLMTSTLWLRFRIDHTGRRKSPTSQDVHSRHTAAATGDLRQQAAGCTIRFGRPGVGFETWPSSRTLGNKLVRRYFVPYIVHRQTSPLNYVVRLVTPSSSMRNQKEDIVPSVRMKRYYSPFLPPQQVAMSAHWQFSSCHNSKLKLQFSSHNNDPYKEKMLYQAENLMRHSLSITF